MLEDTLGGTYYGNTLGGWLTAPGDHRRRVRGRQGPPILTVAWLVARLLDAIFREYLVPITEKTETDLDDQLLPIVRKGTKITVWAVGLVVALNNAG